MTMSNFPDFPLSYLYLAGGGIAMIGLVLGVQICGRNSKDDSAHMVTIRMNTVVVIL